MRLLLVPDNGRKISAIDYEGRRSVDEVSGAAEVARGNLPVEVGAVCMDWGVQLTLDPPVSRADARYLALAIGLELGAGAMAVV